jgi:tetratricopeptide (TPR) repeat protein
MNDDASHARGPGGADSALSPDQIQPALVKAVGLHRAGKLAEAEQIYRAILAVAPDQFDALHLLGVAYSDHGRLEDAEQLIGRALATRPGSAIAHYNQGNVLQRLKRSAEAIACYDKAIAARPDYAEAFYNRGNSWLGLLRWEEALGSYDQAIAIQPNYAEAMNNRGNALGGLKRLEEAISSYDRAIALRADYAEALNNRGNALRDLDRPAEALESYDRAIALDGEMSEFYANRAVALRDLDRDQDAIASYDEALVRRPDNADAHHNRGAVLLRMGRLEEGWPGYEYRWLKEGFAGRPPPAVAPEWRDEPLADRHILIFAEQGLGDVIQGVRYLPQLARAAAKVTFLVPPRLVRLLRPSLPTVEFISRLDDAPPFDFQCALMSLPLRFGTMLSTIPAEVPYLSAEPAAAARWRQQIGDHGFRIGVCWQGNPAATIDVGRSIPLRAFQPLSRLPGVRLISLQKTHGLDQLEDLPPGMKVETLGPQFDAGPDAFIDTAAVMAGLDLIVTSDTSVVHLAGALARPTWLALKYIADWRWLLRRDDSPWYPTLRLYRQPQRGDWDAVFDKMYADLRRHLV